VFDEFSMRIFSVLVLVLVFVFVDVLIFLREFVFFGSSVLVVAFVLPVDIFFISVDVDNLGLSTFADDLDPDFFDDNCLLILIL
jgi:hypothetical protein